MMGKQSNKNIKLVKKLVQANFQLFTKVDELIHDEELDVIQKLNDKILHKKTNYMQ